MHTKEEQSSIEALCELLLPALRKSIENITNGRVGLVLIIHTVPEHLNEHSIINTTLSATPNDQKLVEHIILSAAGEIVRRRKA